MTVARLAAIAAIALPLLNPSASLCLPFSQSGVPYADDFSRYAQGSDASASWETDSIGWAIRDHLFESDGAGRAFAIPRSIPYGRTMTVEAIVRMRKAASPDWKTAGIAIVSGDGDYWQLALVEAPDSAGKSHYVELTEMLGGRWLANTEGATKLTVTAENGLGLNWQYDHPYRLRLELSREGIRGTVAETDGTELARKAYQFSNAAVTSGRPALATGSMAAGFGHFLAEILERASPPPAPIYPTYRSPSTAERIDKATGYFHAARAGGRWWIIDPSGRPFYAVGTDHVNYDAGFSEKLGYSQLRRNVDRRFANEDQWAADSVARLKRWGFNTLGAGCSISTRHRGLVHTEFLSLGTNFTAISDIGPRTTWTGFPDVFHPQFAHWCELQARKLCAKGRSDPWLLGYFLDNELEWYGKNGSPTGLVDEAFKKPADHPAKQALIEFLRKRYPAIESLDRAWGIPALSYYALAHSTEPPTPNTAASAKDRTDFVKLIADRYFAATSAAIRKADPNHMVLGCRFAGQAPPGVFAAAGRYCDIVTVNYYGQVDLERGISTDMPGVMRRYYAEAKRPLMMTEWSFPALDAGLPSAHGAGQRVPTQADKARCYDIYQRALFGLPFMVGSDYFMWADEPALGISSTFPEDSNYGLVDVNDDPWPDLMRTAVRVNRLAYALHAGDTAELCAEIVESGAGPQVRVSNRGKRAASFSVQCWVQGIGRTVRMRLAPRQTQSIPIDTKQAAFAAADVDPEGVVTETDRADNRVSRVVLADRVPSPAILVVNPSAEALLNVPVSVSLDKLGSRWTVRDSSGAAVPSQVDDLPGGAELALRVTLIPARSVKVFRLERGAPQLSRVESGGDRSFSLPGPLRLEHDRGSGNLLDRVLLGNVLLGRYAALIHQTGGQPLWVQPDRVDQIVEYRGPIRTVVLITAALGAPERSPAKTAVNGEGVYTAQQQPAARFQTTYRLTRYEAESWFAARFVRLENTDSRPWTCTSYFHYPISSIEGSAEDDEARGAGATPLWQDSGTGIVYGAVVDTDHLKAQFWKDTPGGAGEHPDIWRETDRTLQPGKAMTATSADTDVLLYGSGAEPGHPGGAVLDRLRALARIRSTVRVTGKPAGKARRGTGRAK